jgi:putative Holliday junction resolvase
LGVDFGSRQIGLALADGAHTLASPLHTLVRTKWSKDALCFQDILATHRIAGIVLGWPLLMNGDQGPRCHSTRHFAENLLNIADLPLLLWDERTSSQASTRVLEKEADLSRQKRRRVIDQTAATWILQGALEALRHFKQTAEQPCSE